MNSAIYIDSAIDIDRVINSAIYIDSAIDIDRVINNYFDVKNYHIKYNYLLIS
jgi:hypothetical protein